MGVSAKYEGVTYYVGNLRLMTEQGVSVSDYLQKTADRLNTEAKTVIWFADEKESVGGYSGNRPYQAHIGRGDKETSGRRHRSIYAYGRQHPDGIDHS